MSSKVTISHTYSKWWTISSGSKVTGAILSHVTYYVTAAILVYKMADFLPLFLKKSGSTAAAAGGGALRAPPSRGRHAPPPPAHARVPPPRGALPPGPPRATSLTTCASQANHRVCRALPGHGLRDNIKRCTSEWLSFPRPSAAAAPRRVISASRGRVPEVSLHTAVKGQFGLGTGRAMGKALKKACFSVKSTERKGNCYCQLCVLHRRHLP